MCIRDSLIRYAYLISRSNLVVIFLISLHFLSFLICMHRAEQKTTVVCTQHSLTQFDYPNGLPAYQSPYQYTQSTLHSQVFFWTDFSIQYTLGQQRVVSEYLRCLNAFKLRKKGNFSVIRQRQNLLFLTSPCSVCNT